MDQKDFVVAITTAVLIKIIKGQELNAYESAYIDGVEEGFDEMSTQEQEHMLNFAHMCEAQLVKEKGRMN